MKIKRMEKPMLSTPYIIKENNCKIEDLYNENEKFVKVYLPHEISEEWSPIIIDNYVVKAILEKYPEKIIFFKSISFNKEFDWDNNMNSYYCFKLCLCCF